MSPKPKVHPDDKNARRRALVCKAFQHGKSAGEIAAEFGITKESASGIIARGGFSRGGKPSPPRRFAWEEASAEIEDLPDGL